MSLAERQISISGIIVSGLETYAPRGVKVHRSIRFEAATGRALQGSALPWKLRRGTQSLAIAEMEMPDTLTPEQRSERMSRIRAKDSKAEMAVRRLVHRMGYRYRLHKARLPGKPDLVFSGRKKIIFVHGCFWHRHDCKLGRLPKTRLDFWLPKLEKNKARDCANQRALSALGWKCLVIWECEIKGLEALQESLARFLEE
ncbi:MAG: very short patch repair endonuclease [Gammaproteobacteria bacterium]